MNRKGLLQKLKHLKNMKKDQWLILILAGVLIFVIALPTGNTKKKETQKSETGSAKQTEKTDIAETEGEEDYVDYLENRLEALLGKMEGVGKVQVMVTLEDQGEQISEKDERESRTSTGEGSGETARTATEVELEYATIFVEENGNKTPYIIQVKNPKVAGVAVVCEGGGNSSVAQNISRAIGALFSIETHKIMVMKME